MPCDQIAALIDQGLDFLSAGPRNVPERHRSLRALFDHSWQLLSPLEQDALVRLTVFRGGFAPEDAFWQKMSRHFRSCQNDDGGWGYQKGSSSANMATAGLATMFLVFDMYHGKNYYTRDNPRPFSGGEAAACLASIRGQMLAAGQKAGDTFSFHGEGFAAGGVGVCEPETWTSVSKSREDKLCATADVSFEATYQNGWDLGTPSVSAPH